MLRTIRKLFGHERGNVLAIAAACLPLIVGAAGLSVDTIQWTLWKRQLQRAADSAAIAGVYDRQANAGSTSNVSRTITRDLALNNETWMSLLTGYPTITYPANAGIQTNQVNVSLAIQQPLPFSSLFVDAPVITANATAAGIMLGDPCILALDPTAGSAVYFSGNAEVKMPDCPVFSDSAATNAAIAKGSSAVTAKSVGAVGGIQQSNNFSVKAYYPYSASVPDPYADVVPVASEMHCTTAELDEGTSTSTIGTGTGQYNCFSALSVKSNKSLTIPSSYTGPIYINGGSIDFKGDFTCAACTIVLTNSSTSTAATIGNITANASANVNITAPTSGTYKGLAIYQDRRAVDCNNCNKINGNSSSLITGAMYFPKQELQYNGTGNTSAVCAKFVAKRITFTGNSGTNQFRGLDQCTDYFTDGGSLMIVRLVG
ncbi:hypothetical protein HMF7854_08455 [Sphingomonas ginkgonis]|uniref:Putative Flp pilus-assembly TadG-like N-terminal domain-containing protein n=1 Tax=Sphingomonas ginkgonis TaxID=2315330 RepID=A0A3R9YMH2_9SPHN|nr:pilus assembly protein TadG-related protein [Sphingomonas ginkgonis]RST30868.1 hypothetical protein HMF7854_08455 [Sphingomonas ginkgonis]